MKKNAYISALTHSPELATLEQKLRAFYTSGSYHEQHIKGINANWQPSSHPAQLRLVEFLNANMRMLEMGCGDGTVGAEIVSRVPGIQYYGVDVNPAAWVDSTLDLTAASATSLPFANATFDATVSMYVIEHVVYPHRFLEEAWRVLKPGAQLLLIAPDFRNNPMASEEIGLSYGAGTTKLQRGSFIDAALTAYDSRLRIPRIRKKHNARVDSGEATFPILLNPRCLRLPGFVPDCDAVYPSTPEEIVVFLKKLGACDDQIFYRDGHTFGLRVVKA